MTSVLIIKIYPPPHGTIVVTCPGKLILITPAHAHISIDCAVSAGILPTIAVGAPGAQGAMVVGIHGIGVSTPRAAAVAAATVGLAMLLHIPKGGIFTSGLLSIIFAIGIPFNITRLKGITINAAGAIPNEHIIIAPEQTAGQLMATPPIVSTVYGRHHHR